MPLNLHSLFGFAVSPFDPLLSHLRRYGWTLLVSKSATDKIFDGTRTACGAELFFNANSEQFKRFGAVAFSHAKSQLGRSASRALSWNFSVRGFALKPGRKNPF